MPTRRTSVPTLSHLVEDHIKPLRPRLASQAPAAVPTVNQSKLLPFEETYLQSPHTVSHSGGIGSMEAKMATTGKHVSSAVI